VQERKRKGFGGGRESEQIGEEDGWGEGEVRERACLGKDVKKEEERKSRKQRGVRGN